MKILYILTGGLFNSGGIERVVSIKANYFAEKAGYDVSIATTEQMGRPVFYPLSEKIQLYHFDIGFGEKFGKESYFLKIISRFQQSRIFKKKIINLLAEIQPDITISNLGGWDIEFLNQLKDGSIKIGELHFPGNYRQLMARKLSKALIPNIIAKYRTRIFKNECQKLSQLVVLTEEEKSFWKNTGNITVIPNPAPFYISKSSTTQNKKAIAVGRLVYEKGFDWMIEAWKIVSKKHPDWELNIFGDGDQKETLLSLIKKYNLEGIVTIHEPIGQIEREYLSHSMLLFTSRYLDGLPMVLIEASVCGLPLISFDTPCGPKDVIQDGVNGFLVTTGDIDGLVNKIDKLIESENLRQMMGKNAKDMASVYQIKLVMQQWVNLFNKLKYENNSFVRH